MKTIAGSTGTTISCTVAGDGPPLVLIHGAFSDHETNWTFVAPRLCQRCTVFALARRGRGETDATVGHTIEDEGQDVVDMLRAIGEPVNLIGHSYGAHCALIAAHRQPDLIRRLVLYEPPWPEVVSPDALAALETLAAADAWDQFAFAFFANVLRVPGDELDALRASDIWHPIVADACASLGDLRAIAGYRFEPARFATLSVPVLLQVGSESPRDLYATDALAAVLPDARIQTLDGQAHEAMTTAPELYAEAIMQFLLAGDEHVLVAD